MEKKDKDNALSKNVDELSLAIPIPTSNGKRRLYLQQPQYYHEYNPQTEAELSDEHRQLRRLLNYFEDKASTDTIFGDYAVQVFETVDKQLFHIWWSKIEVTMEEVFPLLDGLMYGRDTIALLSVVSPSSYRLLYKAGVDKYDPPNPTFTLESGIIGSPLQRKPDLKLRREIFYEEATRAIKNAKTTMYTSFIAARIQATFHGRNIANATNTIRRAFWKLSDSTPDVNHLALEYEILSLMKAPAPPKSKLCLRDEEIVYEYDQKKWYSIPKPRPKKRGMKVSASKKREDSRKRMIKYRARKLADKHSFRTVSELNSTASFRRELRSRSSSISKKQTMQSTGARTPTTRSQGPSHQSRRPITKSAQKNQPSAEGLN